jgi:hypothetical protein
MIGPSQRPVPDNPQHSQEKDIHALGGMRTRITSKRAAADPRLRPRGDWMGVIDLYCKSDKLECLRHRHVCQVMFR